MSTDLTDLKAGDPVLVVWDRGRGTEPIFYDAKVGRVARVYFHTEGEEYFAKGTFHRKDGRSRSGPGLRVFRDRATYEALQDRLRREQAARRHLYAPAYGQRVERLDDDELATLMQLLEKINEQ